MKKDAAAQKDAAAIDMQKEILNILKGADIKGALRVQVAEAFTRTFSQGIENIIKKEVKELFVHGKECERELTLDRDLTDTEVFMYLMEYYEYRDTVEVIAEAHKRRVRFVQEAIEKEVEGNSPQVKYFKEKGEAKANKKYLTRI